MHPAKLHSSCYSTAAITAIITLLKLAVDAQQLRFGKEGYETFFRDPADDSQSLIIRSDSRPIDFPTPLFDDDGQMEKNWTLKNKESRRGAKFRLNIVDFARGPTLTTVTVATEAVMKYNGCFEEGKNETFSRCTNGSYSLMVNVDLSGKEDYSLLTLYNIFEWASGYLSRHVDVTRLDERKGRIVERVDELLTIETNWEQSEIKCDGSEECHKRLLPCDMRTASSTTVKDVTENCCQCYPGKTKWRCENDNGERQSMEEARIEFEKTAFGDCDQPDSLGKPKNFGKCPYFCECGECWTSLSNDATKKQTFPSTSQIIILTGLYSFVFFPPRAFLNRCQ